MRNIALLEWGPASLFYIQPRERIKVRTVWLDGGPVLPPFLSTLEETKSAHVPDLCVRYALSTFEDLNSAIKNLRRCFGFPYQEYIGYLNTLTQTHRARREHEVLIDRMKRWAMFGNVDAVLWIDYAKANQPPGSFKMGPRDSRPFSAAHMEICTDVPGGPGSQDVDDESEAAWSDLEDEHGGHSGTMGAAHSAAMVANHDSLFGQASHRASLGLPPRVPGTLRPFKRFSRNSDPRSNPAPLGGNSIVNTLGGSSLGAAAAAANAGNSIGSGTGGATAAAAAPSIPTKLSGELVRAVSLGTEMDGSPLPSREQISRNTKEQERAMIRTMLQEEFVPVHGSIYTRSIAPGPGYYGAPTVLGHKDGVPGFRRRPPSHFEEVIAASKELPGPGDYKSKASLVDAAVRLGRFGKAVKLVPITESARKLPFISSFASACEAKGLHSPSLFYSVGPEAAASARGFIRAPKYSFGRCRRPF